MLQTLRELSWAFTSWRTQVFHLAVNAMLKQTRRAAFGWVWIFVKPAMYITCFYFALNVGLRSARISDMDGVTYMLWLAAGVIPWFYVQATLNGGSSVFKKYAYLVNKLKFPVPLIPVFHQLGQMFVHLMLLVCLSVAYFLTGHALDIYALQLVFLVLLMYIFSVGWSLLVSSLTSLSKDLLNLIKALSTPIFWLSGILFNLSNIHSQLVHTIMLFNPVTFLVSGYRKVFVNFEGFKGWIWDDPVFFGCGLGVIAFTFIMGLIVYSKMRKDIPDVL